MPRSQHPWSDTVRALELMLGAPLLVAALVESPVRWVVVTLALLLLGVITLDTVAAWTQHRTISAMSTTDPNAPDVPEEEEAEPEEDDEPDTPAT